MDNLDVTLNLSDDSYKPFQKLYSETNYIHRESNYPLSVIKLLLLSFEPRLSKLSSDENIFIQAASIYQEALKQNGYNHKLIYNNSDKYNSNSNNEDNYNNNATKNDNNYNNKFNFKHNKNCVNIDNNNNKNDFNSYENKDSNDNNGKAKFNSTDNRGNNSNNINYNSNGNDNVKNSNINDATNNNPRTSKQRETYDLIHHLLKT